MPYMRSCSRPPDTEVSNCQDCIQDAFLVTVDEMQKMWWKQPDDTTTADTTGIAISYHLSRCLSRVSIYRCAKLLVKNEG